MIAVGTVEGRIGRFPTWHRAQVDQSIPYFLGPTATAGKDASAQAAKTLVMKLFGTGPLSFDHSGKNAFYARLDFAGP